MHLELQRIAETVAADILADNPELEGKLQYDLHIEYTGSTRAQLGLIDIGEYYQEVYEWDPQGREWAIANVDYQASLAIINNVRRNRGAPCTPENCIRPFGRYESGDYSGAWRFGYRTYDQPYPAGEAQDSYRLGYEATGS